MGSPYREHPSDGRRLEPDRAARRKVHAAGITTAVLGLGIGATAPMLGPLAAVLGGGIALLGVALFREAPKNAMRAPCPLCSAEIGEIDPLAEAVRCPTCGDYVRARSGMLFELPDDYVAAEPIFAIPLRRASTHGLPPICAECGAPNARHLVPLEVNALGVPLGDAAYREDRIPSPPNSAFRLVRVPHCAAHDSGAAADLGAVRVRSRALWIAARERLV